MGMLLFFSEVPEIREGSWTLLFVVFFFQNLALRNCSNSESRIKAEKREHLYNHRVVKVGEEL